MGSTTERDAAMSRAMTAASRDVELRALAERLAGTVRRADPDTEKRAASWFLGALGWNDADVARACALADLSGPARAVAERAWRWTVVSRSDPHRSAVPASRAPAVALADLALAGRPIDADDWRACDRSAALDVLSSLASRRARRGRDGASTRRRTERARRRISALEPSLPDRR